ncbi:MAG: phage tail tape measure protein [Clostridium sp.]|nr:phage tail tape measure protein [Clostridium sp.]
MAKNDKKVSVEFSVKSDEFNRNLTQTKQQIKQTTAELQTASAKLNTYGNNIQNLSAKQSLLEKSITGVNQKMKLYQENIDKNNQKLKTNQEALTKLGDKKKELSSQYKEAVKLYGEESEEAIKLKEALDQCKNEYKETENKIKSNNKAINSNTVEIQKSETELVKLQGELKNTNKAIQENSNHFLKASEDFKKAGDKLEKMGGRISDIGGNLMKLSAPIVGVSALAVKSAMDFESAFTGVVKTVDATPAELAKIKDGILEMSKHMPQSASAIAEVAESAGQLGIETPNILDFTKTMIMLGDATNLTATEGASQLAKFANIVGMSQDNFSNLGSVIVALGNNLATTEADIVSMGMNLAGAGKQVKMSEAEIMAFAGALSSVGIEAEAGGTAFSKVMINMQLACETGSDSLQDFASIAGMTTDEFKTAFETNASGAIISFIRGLGDAEKQGSSAIKVIDDMGITEVRLRDALLRASSASDVFSNAINIGTTAWEENTALSKEAETRYATFASKVEMLKNRFKELGIEIGEDVLPYVSDFMDELEGLVDWFGNLDKETQQSIIKFGLFTFASGGVLKVVGSLSKGVGGLCKDVSGLLKWLGKLGGATKTVGNATGVATKGIGALSGGLTAFSGVLPVAIGAVGLLGVGMYTAHEYGDVMNSTILKSTDEMSYMEQIIAQLTDTQRYSREELEKMGITYGEWNEGVSKETQSNLDEMATKVRNLRFEIYNTNMDNLINEEEKDNLITKTNELCDGIIETIKSRREESNKAMSDMFNVGDGAVDEAEQEILEILDKTGQAQIEKVTENKEKMNEIYKKASEEKRELTKEDMIEIDQLMKQTQQIAYENLVNSEEEKIKAQAEFDTRAKNMNQQNLSEMLIEKKTAMDTEKETIRANYDIAIEELKIHADKLTGTEREKVLKMIELKENERKALLDKESDKYQNYIKLAQEKYPELLNNINRFTGEIMTAKDIKRLEDFEKEKAHYKGLEEITADGNYKVYNIHTKTWDDVKVKVDETTGEITTMTKFWVDETGIHYADAKGYSQNYCNQLDEEARKEQQERGKQIVAIQSLAREHWNTEGQITDASGNVIYALEQVTTAEDGTLQGVLNLNGTPLNIKVNKDGTISNLEEIIKKLAGIKDKEVNVTVNRIERAWQNNIKPSNYIDEFAEGGTVQNASTVVGNERGMELWDSISSNARMLSSAMQGDLIQAPSNTKVTNALMTTAKMEREIKSEVSRQLDINISNAIKDAILELYKRNLFNNKDVKIDNNVTINHTGTKFDEMKTEINLDKLIRKSLRESGLLIR